MADNNPNSSPEIHRTQVSRMYGILAPIGVVLLVTTVILLSYFFAHRRRTATQSVRISGAAAPSDRDTDDDEAAEPGLDEATIILFPVLLYSQAAKNRSDSPSPPSGSPSSPSPPSVSPSSCSICLTNYEETDTVRILPECKHFFHVKCVDPWLMLNATCPICRKSLIRHLPGTDSVTAG